DLEAGTYAIETVASGFISPPRQRVTLVAGQTARLETTLEAGAVLRGLVHDAVGPVVGAEVRVVPRAQTLSGDAFTVGGMRGTYTLEDGTFSVEGLESDQWYDVTVASEWHAQGAGGGRPAESVVDIALVATGKLTGDVAGEATDARVSCEA